MVFSSITFLFYFLPIVLLIYYIVPKKCKNIVLLISSLIFYFFGEPKYVFLMLISILSAYIHGLLIEKYRETKKAKIFLITSIIVSLGLLVYFKYADFLITNINLWLNQEIGLLGVILPIGISFYTFQIISYIVDVYRGDVKVQKNFFTLATYVALFPQLIAGPIVRYSDIERQLEDRKTTVASFSNGIRRFTLGLAKKILIANVLGELANVFIATDEKTVIFYWIYAISIMLQIYFDFSGYSDMAIGLGKMFGFEFIENFNYPYISKSITEFWRRWHISLSSWFRDYIYIPLGGNRTTKIKWLRNILVVWLLTGLWHGADWNFILWGVFFGIILIIEKLFLDKILKKTPKILNHIYVLFLVMISFILFDAESLGVAINNIQGLFGIGNIPFSSVETLYYLKSYAIILIIAVIASTQIGKKLVERIKNKKSRNNKFFRNNIYLCFTYYLYKLYYRWII